MALEKFHLPYVLLYKIYLCTQLLNLSLHMLAIKEKENLMISRKKGKNLLMFRVKP